jgi:hypothetical protein
MATIPAGAAVGGLVAGFSISSHRGDGVPTTMWSRGRETSVTSA